MRQIFNSIKSKAFTLAETLIVIGILGVVAALTLPNLNHATGDKEKVTRVKKIYSALTDAFDRAQAVYGDYDTWFLDLDDENYAKINERFMKRITEFMKISKDCALEVDKGCFTSGPTHRFDGTEYAPYDTYTDYYKVITADGMSILYIYQEGTIWVDIDGPNKGPYTFGKDLFGFTIIEDDNTIYPYHRYWDDGKGNCTNFHGGVKYRIMSDGDYASCWILNFDNADYLKADSEGKCKDSDIILDGITNTSCH